MNGTLTYRDADRAMFAAFMLSVVLIIVAAFNAAYGWLATGIFLAAVTISTGPDEEPV